MGNYTFSQSKHHQDLKSNSLKLSNATLGLKAPSVSIFYNFQTQNWMLQKRTTEKSWRHSKKTHFKGPVTGLDPSSRNWKAPGKYNEVGQIINKYLWPEQQYFECVCKHGSLPMKLDLLQSTLQTNSFRICMETINYTIKRKKQHR